MKIGKRKRLYPKEDMASGSQFERTDPDYIDHRMEKMRIEYRSLPPQWRDVYLAGLSKRDAEAVLAETHLT